MKNKSFTLIEALIYIYVFSLTLIMVFSFLFWLFNYNSKTQEQINNLFNSSMALGFMSEKIKLADSIYHPTCSLTQLSLEDNNEYIDFYLCEDKLCFKQELKEPIVLIPKIERLSFEIIDEQGIKISLNNLITTIFLR
ncbi:MAG: hypothetical protein PHN37_00900 [Candidatus Pacebacteria bacterium]|nr:hypothetical protein [Candidatus Paceibacterota bacterium]